MILADAEVSEAALDNTRLKCTDNVSASFLKHRQLLVFLSSSHVCARDENDNLINLSALLLFSLFLQAFSSQKPKMSHHQRPQELAWAKPFSIDLLLKVANVTFLHPFVAWIIPLCMRAQAMSWEHPAIRITIGYASLLTALFFLNILNRQLAYSKPRKVDFSEEVIVITGGASGLGLLVAEVYGMRGATVAVLDVKDLEAGEARGVSHYKCDVGDINQITKVALEIERDVSSFFVSSL